MRKYVVESDAIAKLNPLWKTNPIQYLVLWKFPRLAIYSALEDRENQPATSKEIEEMHAAAERYREELETLPAEEIQVLVKTAREDEARRYRAYLENQERQRPFNQPDAYADFSYWASASYWSP